MNYFDRVYGCLAGIALGDALGMPTEMLTQEQISSQYGWVDDLVRAPEWHPHYAMKVGQVTDDTGQALAVVRAYDEKGCITARSMAHELIVWLESLNDAEKLCVGPSTQKAIEALQKGADPHTTGRSGTTNGASMRAPIVGLMNPGNIDNIMLEIVETCLPTHFTHPAISGAAAVACAVGTAVCENSTLEGILQAAKDGARAGALKGEWMWATGLESRITLAETIVKENLYQPSKACRELYDYVGVDMLVAESVATAFGLVLLAEGDPMKAVTMAANIGGDTDTIGVIAGAVCGAYMGITAVNTVLLEKIEAVNHLSLAQVAEGITALAEIKGK
ncbi:MAG TPA: ADP-ribosylglycohydrolase family protein [Longilinea sp.]|nr:ADP-ribosylglycohydrolase family protein [Longilinea sp.]